MPTQHKNSFLTAEGAEVVSFTNLRALCGKNSGLRYLFALVWLLFGCQLTSLLPGGTAVSGVNRDDALYLVGGQPQTLDPALTRGGPDSALGHIFSGLTTLDTTLQVQPELAAGWSVSGDGLVYTFYLRPEARFHNGRSLTAHDIIYSWERAADPATGSDTAETYLGDIRGVAEKLAGQAETISGLRALDDHTLEVTLTAPVAYFLAKLAYPVAYVVDREQVSQPNWQYQANGSGPFKLARWQDDEIIVLERFDDYYRESARLAHVVINLGPVLSLAQYETGQIDLVGIGGANLEQARDPNNPFSQELQTAVSLCTSVLGLDTTRPPFDNPLVRQAFNYALDKNLLIETFANGNALPALGPLPPGMPGYGLSDVEGYPYDPERARALLAEAGYSNMDDFPVLAYYTAGYGDLGGYATAVITLWQENLGVTIEPVILDPFTYYDTLYSGDTGHIFNSGWCADYPDPQNFLDVLYHSDSRQNLGGFQDPALDALLEAARVEPEENGRLQLYAAAEQRIVEAAPVVFTSHGLSAVLVKPDLKNHVLTPLGVRQWHLLER
jgi:oligopeptide transport system substrate-binding protein